MKNEHNQTIDAPTSSGSVDDFVEISPFGLTREISTVRVVGVITVASNAAQGVYSIGNCNNSRPYFRFNIVRSTVPYMVDQKTRHKITGADVADVVLRMTTVQAGGLTHSAIKASLNILIEV